MSQLCSHHIITTNEMKRPKHGSHPACGNTVKVRIPREFSDESVILADPRFKCAILLKMTGISHTTDRNRTPAPTSAALQEIFKCDSCRPKLVPFFLWAHLRSSNINQPGTSGGPSPVRVSRQQSRAPSTDVCKICTAVPRLDKPDSTWADFEQHVSLKTSVNSVPCYVQVCVALID